MSISDHEKTAMTAREAEAKKVVLNHFAKLQSLCFFVKLNMQTWLASQIILNRWSWLKKMYIYI